MRNLVSSQPIAPRTRGDIIFPGIAGEAGRNALVNADGVSSSCRHATGVGADHAAPAASVPPRGLVRRLTGLIGSDFFAGLSRAGIGCAGNAGSVDVAVRLSALAQIIHPVRMRIAAHAFAFEAIDGERG